MEDDEETAVLEESASMQLGEHPANKDLALVSAAIDRFSPQGFGNLPRKQKRKDMKKIKRKQLRQEAAEKERLEQERRLQDPSEQLKIRLQEQEEAEALAKERLEHDTLERMWLEREKIAQEDAERRRREEIEKQEERKRQAELDEGENDWEYVEEGPAEIIWEGNEIIVRKQKVRVPRAGRGRIDYAEDENRLISNPLPPQSIAFAAHQKLADSNSSATMLDLVEQTPNFGTEQDKTHCPFHIKTGVCRFGVRCSRAHVNSFYDYHIGCSATHLSMGWRFMAEAVNVVS